jgi:hypothetical protein
MGPRLWQCGRPLFGDQDGGPCWSRFTCFSPRQRDVTLQRLWFHYCTYLRGCEYSMRNVHTKYLAKDFVFRDPCFVLFQDMGLLCSPCWVWTHDPPASASWVLRLQSCTTTLGCDWGFCRKVSRLPSWVSFLQFKDWGVLPKTIW